MDAVVLNIEQFHTVNDLHGREFGDEVLRVIGSEIRAFLRESEGIASRIEADRFDIYCIHQNDYASLLERFQKKVSEISPNISIHLRMGVKEWQKGIEPFLLFDRAQVACSKVRGDYQTPLMIYNEDMQKKELLNQQLLNDLRPAIEHHQFEVYYQPKYDIRCNPPRLCSCEALIRWNHTDLGMIPPFS